jgi:FkbM family methyltransferase
MPKSALKRLSDRIRRDLWYLARGRGLQAYGIPIYVPSDIPWDVFKQIIRGHYEIAEKTLIERHLPPDLPVIELGGSIGVISAIIRRRLQPAAPMVVVEANPRIVDLCKKNAASGAGRVEVLNAAISYAGGSIGFAASDDYLSGRIADRPDTASVVVETTTLAAVSRSFEEFSLVMDIEGAEYDVFENDVDALRRCRLAIVEIHPDASRTEEYFLKLAERSGFKMIDREADVLALARAADD